MKYYLHGLCFGDFEVTEEHFNRLVSFVSSKVDNGFPRYKIVQLVDDREPNVTYFYIWCRNSDFFYLGYVERSI